MSYNELGLVPACRAQSSYWLDVSSGATIILLEAAVFVIVFLGTTLARRRPSWADQAIPTLAHDRPADDLG